MFELYLNEDRLDLPPDFSIDHEILNSFLDLLVIEGEFTWDFTLPDTPRNRRLLRFAHLVESSEARKQFEPCRWVLAGRTWKRGLLYFMEYDEGFVVHFVGGNGELSEKLKDTKIADLDWPSISYSTPLKEHMFTVASEGYAQHDFTYFYISLIGDTEPLNLISSGTPPHFFDGTGLISPQPYVHKILERIETHFAIRIDFPAFALDEMKRLVMMNTIPANPKTDSGYAAMASPYSLKDCLPDISVKDFISNLAAFFNHHISFDSNEQTLRFIHRKPLLESAPEEDWSESLLEIRPLYRENIDFGITYTVREEDRIDAFVQDPPAGEGAELVECGFGAPYAPISTTPISVLLQNVNSLDEIPNYLLFYRGIIQPPGSPFAALPRASSGPWIGDDFTTYLNGSGSAYETWYGNSFSQINRLKAAEVDIHLTRDQLLRFRSDRVYRLGRYRCIFKKLKFTARPKELANVEGEVYIF